MRVIKRPDKWGIEDIENVFSDRNQLAEGEWSQKGLFVSYGDSEHDCIEVSLSKDTKEYAKQASYDFGIPEDYDFYTLTVFDGDEISADLSMYADEKGNLSSVGDTDKMMKDYQSLWKVLKERHPALEKALNDFSVSKKQIERN